MAAYHGSRHTAVFADTYAVAVQAHGHPSVGIAGVDEITGQVKVGCDNRSECVIGSLVGGVRTPVDKSAELFLGDGIIQQRTVMTLHHKLEAVARTGDCRPHAVAHEYVLQFGMQFKMIGIGVLSDSHRSVFYASPSCIASSSKSSRNAM